jgi:hypothetical protein
MPVIAILLVSPPLKSDGGGYALPPLSYSIRKSPGFGTFQLTAGPAVLLPSLLSGSAGRNPFDLLELV